MNEKDQLIHGPLGQRCLHLCVDMQKMFAEDTPWHTPWMKRVVPNVQRLVEHAADRTLFTRFIPAEVPGEGNGTWRRYYERWKEMTVAHLGHEMVELVDELAPFVPPAAVFDKRVYSPWLKGDLDRRISARGIDTLIVTGGETEVCVLAAVLGAVDLGYRVILVTDAICSSSDETHDAQIEVYRKRFGQQVETPTTEEVIRAWS
jgi:nicotinamidase-related amidase